MTRCPHLRHGFSRERFLAPAEDLGPGPTDLRASGRTVRAPTCGVSAAPTSQSVPDVRSSTDVGAGSIVYMLESQSKYIRRPALSTPRATQSRYGLTSRIDTTTRKRSRAVVFLVDGCGRKVLELVPHGAAGVDELNWPALHLHLNTDGRMRRSRRPAKFAASTRRGQAREYPD